MFSLQDCNNYKCCQAQVYNEYSGISSIMFNLYIHLLYENNGIGDNVHIIIFRIVLLVHQYMNVMSRITIIKAGISCYMFNQMDNITINYHLCIAIHHLEELVGRLAARGPKDE